MQQINEIRNLLDQIEANGLETNEFETNEFEAIEKMYSIPIEKPWLYDKQLSAYQRVLLSIMVDKQHDGFNGCRQSSLVSATGFSNKTVRDGMQLLAQAGYAKRGVKAGSWQLV